MIQQMKWEYCELTLSEFGYYSLKGKIVKSIQQIDHPKLIAQLGSDGWELVCVVIDNLSYDKKWVFKRFLEA